MRARRLVPACCVAVVLATAAAADTRVLDPGGNVLTVGNWIEVPVDAGGVVRFNDRRFMSWELRQGSQVLGSGLVPGTEDLGSDHSPALSRDPVSGDTWLAWSRQASVGSDLLIARFSAFSRAFDAPQVVASGPWRHSTPAVMHDAAGTLYVAWIDEAQEGSVRLAAFGPGGVSLGERTSSSGIAKHNSAPALGIDTLGRILLAFRGQADGDGTPKVFVLAAFERGSGASHVPVPILELGLRGSAPEPLSVPGPGAPPAPAPVLGPVRLTVLGGMPIAYWVEGSDPETQVLHYMAEGSAGWSGATVESVDMGAGMASTVGEVLQMLEARFRHVERIGGGGHVPLPLFPIRPIRRF